MTFDKESTKEDKETYTRGGGDPRRWLDKAATKEAVKEALKEWLDDKYTAFGKWSLHGLLAMMLAVVVYLFLIQNGWHK